MTTQAKHTPPAAEIITKVGKGARDKVYLQVSDDAFGHIEIGSCTVGDEGKRHAFRVLVAALNSHAGLVRERDEMADALRGVLSTFGAYLDCAPEEAGDHAALDTARALLAKLDGAK